MGKATQQLIPADLVVTIPPGVSLLFYSLRSTRRSHSRLRLPGSQPLFQVQSCFRLKDQQTQYTTADRLLCDVHEEKAQELGAPLFAADWKYLWTIGPKPGVPPSFLTLSMLNMRAWDKHSGTTAIERC